MSVDGIGGGGRSIGPIDAPLGTNAAEGVTEAGQAAQAEGTSAASALERLGRGEIDLEHYLEGRVTEAVEHLQGRVPPSQIDFIRAALRESLSSDPVLLELVRRATGQVPPPRAD